MTFLDMERSRLAWWVFGGVLFAALTYVVYSFVGTFVFGIFIYYATRPIYRRLKRRVRPPSLAAAVALFALALPALTLIAYALAIATSEFLKLTDDGAFDLSQYPITSDQLSRFTDPNTLLSLDASDVSRDQLASVVESLSSAADTLAFFGIGAIHLFVMIALAFYLLRDDHRLTRWTRSRFADDRGVFDAYMTAVDNDFNNIFFGNILNAVLTGTIGVIAYTALNMLAPAEVRIPAAALVGLLAGVASLIPVVGMKLVYVPVALYMAVQSYLVDPTSFWFVIVFVAISFVVVDTIPDLVLRPYVSGRRLHVGAVMIAYTFGPLLFGWYGIFLAPMILVLVVNFAKYVLPELISGDPIRPYAVDPAAVSPAETTPSTPNLEPDVETPPGAGTGASGETEAATDPADDEGEEMEGGDDAVASRDEPSRDDSATPS
jgi:predicted PurR-regulated permease PerM